MSISIRLKAKIQSAFLACYQQEIELPKLEKTKPEFEGDYTLVIFPYLKISGKNPEATAHEIGEELLKHSGMIASYNVIKGFLNLVISDATWNEYVNTHFAQMPDLFQLKDGNGEKVMVEYSSPNTNKPLHLGHVRNNLLGYSIAKIMEYNGYEVIKANLINDRGIHICKSMLAWMRFGHGETPESSGLKGDHLVGKYYVEFDKAYKKQIEELVASGLKKEDAEKQAPLLLEAQEMLRKWEDNDPEVRKIWETMNQWVYAGFEKSYARLGVSFDQYYYESNTYLLGKDLVQEGLDKAVFEKQDDGSVWIDLTAEKLDRKVLLRSDGTSVYMTQDLGTAELKYQDYQMNRSIYVVGNEQDYHFRVLFKILEKLNRPFASGLYHLSYGMVDLPSGKMKSREGTVVDADDLMQEMHQTAEDITRELGKIQGLSEEELYVLFEKIGMGALKYFLLKVDPQKRILFDPKESIDFQGNTGPFLQYTYARINSLLSNAGAWQFTPYNGVLEAQERELIRTIHDLPEVIRLAAENYSPALIANHCYDLVKAYNRFYHDLPVLKEENPAKKKFRIGLSHSTLKAMHACFDMLGIPPVERM